MNIKSLLELDFLNLKNSTNISKYNNALNLLLKYQIVLEHKINSFISFFYIDKEDFKNFGTTDVFLVEYFDNIELYIHELTNVDLNVNHYKEQVKSLNVHPNIKKEIRESINLIFKRIKLKCRDVDIKTIEEFKCCVSIKYSFVLNEIESIWSWKKIVSKLKTISDKSVQDFYENLERDIQFYIKKAMEMKQNIYKEYNILLNDKTKWFIIDKLKNIKDMKTELVEKIETLLKYYYDDCWKIINIIKHQKFPQIEFRNELECYLYFDHVDVSMEINFENIYHTILKITDFKTGF